MGENGIVTRRLSWFAIGFAQARSALQCPSRRVVEWREIEGDQLSDALVAGDRRVAETFDERACHGGVDRRDELEPERRDRRCEHRHFNDSGLPAEEYGDPLDHLPVGHHLWAAGIERLALRFYALDDIRVFYENDLRFLEQLAL